MDDYFHLNLKKFGGEERPAQEAKTPAAPAPRKRSPDDPEITEKLPTLSLMDPVAEEDNSDPYNSSGRLNSKDFPT